ncbi:Autophagy-related protein 2 homolog A [Eumeta japonica]|uniref:Autophagy-related protein 2 n=1 Tax=Eumeta variegata TaxID=151549 RepID=A0A4C1Y5E1_EUMVA|nr:Autophagy-related protein 2 homolog A [Eumeta japonica]
MPWYLPWSENIKKRACRYLLQRYLGNFLEEKLTLDQLRVDLYNGKGTVSDVSLDCEALNELGDTQNWPLQIVDGYMQEISVTIPWSTLLKDDSIVEVNGLLLTVQPKIRSEPASSMFESMWSSMSSSMQLATECLQQEDGPPDAHPVEGIEMFAHAIDSILSRVKVKFINTKIRIEHVPKNSDKGIALEIHIKLIDYYDEAGSEPPPEVTDPENAKTYLVSTFTSKKILFEGVTFYTDEYPSKLRTMARSLIMEKSGTSHSDKSTMENSQTEASSTIYQADINYQSTTSEIFYETRSIISTTEHEPLKNIYSDSDNTCKREPTPEERANQPDPILFAKLTGRQELSLKIKHSEEAAGPKVDLQLTLGSLIVFLTPRQLHTLIELAEGLNQPHLQDTSNIPMRPSTVNTQCKPLDKADFDLIEAQLLSNFAKDRNKSYASHGWSGPSYDDNDLENEHFYPMALADDNFMGDSLTSSVSSTSASMTSSVNIMTTQPRIKRNRKVPQIDGDPTAEVSHINIKIASCSCILLHKDILLPVPLGSEYISFSSIKKMQDASNEFFERLGLFAISGHGSKDFEIANNFFDNATSRSHLRLITTALSVDGSEKTTSHGSQTSGEIVLTHLHLRECLYLDTSESSQTKPESFDLIRFERIDTEDVPSNLMIQPNVNISFKQTLKYVRASGERKLLYPITDVRFPIADLRPEINREIRRVRADFVLFKLNDLLITSQQLPSLRPTPTVICISATNIDLYYHENETCAGTHVARANMDNCPDSNILGGTPNPLPVISITFQPKNTGPGHFDACDDELSYEPTSMIGNPMMQSVHIMDKLRDNSLPSPFSSKKMAHQGITSHENGPQVEVEELIVPGNEEEMNEFTQHSVQHSLIHLDLNLPVVSLQLESKQLYEIIYNRINSDLLLWEPHIVNQYEVGPHLLLMCEDNSHEPSIYPAFSMCKSGLGYESDSQSSSTDDDNVYYSTYESKLKQRKVSSAQPAVQANNGRHDFCLTMKINKGVLTVFAPVRDSNKRVVPGQMGELVLDAKGVSLCQVSGANGRPKHSLMCLRATNTSLYHEGIMSIPSDKPPLRLHGSLLPSHLKETIYPSSKGVLLKERVLKRDMFTIALSVEPHKELLSFKKICMAIGIEQATLRHRGNAGIAWLTQLLDVIDVLDYPVPGYTPSTVLTELHVHVWDCAIDYRPLYLPIRTVVTLGNFSMSSNVIAQTNTSNLRFIAQECALFLSHLYGTKPGLAVPQDDEKKPNLQKDYVCVIDLGLFELSLRMADKTNVVGPHVDLCASNNAVHVRTCWDSASALCRLLTYVAGDGDSQPPVQSVQGSRHTSFCSDRGEETLVGLEDHLEEIRELSPSEIQQVNDLMEEAMKESPNTTLEEDDFNTVTEKEGVEIFFFPDESNGLAKLKQTPSDIGLDGDPKNLEYEEFISNMPEMAEEAKPTIPQVAKDLGDPSASPKVKGKKSFRKAKSSEGSNTDDEYCIIDSHAHSEDDDLAEPIVKWYGSGTTPIIDNHFTIPVAKTDVLKAPKNFPAPVLRYTLCDMSVIWHMFGGNDFKTPSEAAASSTAKKNVTITEGDIKSQGSPTASKRNTDYDLYETGRSFTAVYKHGISWQSGQERVQAHRPESVIRTWKTRGGPQRDHNTLVQLHLTKVKFQYETYPAGGTHASRQTLAVGKVEVHDRLAVSHINKFLSQYVSKDEPERKHSHMIVIKAVHLRPDPALSAQECCLKVSLLPLRFHIDQDTLLFLVNFFSKLDTDENSVEFLPPTTEEDNKSIGSGGVCETSGSRQHTPTHRPPVMSVASQLRDPPPTPTSLADIDTHSLTDKQSRDEEPLMENYEAERLVSENLIQLEEDFQRLGTSEESSNTRRPSGTPSEPIDDSPLYFRRVVFSPEVPIRLDYVGKRVDLSAGPVAGLLMGLGQLNCSELKLKRLCHRHGLLGVERLVRWALQEWLADIKRHQLPGLLSGIGPMHSLLQLLTGIRDLVWLPVEQWRRDGRLVHGLRRGAASFTARTAVAALDITQRLLHLIQASDCEIPFAYLVPNNVASLVINICSPNLSTCFYLTCWAAAETTFDMLTPGPTLALQDAYERRARRRRHRHDPARQPTDIREGVASAYHTVRELISKIRVCMAAAGGGT